ncbi:hypothetical protein RRG08_038308 [Elysia crispata]|uniref:Uncharacterized protein n=1 Tax=Elysia crispata TaxID=231223 RepID=A0AAE1E1T2_9GAST|nr:hypothetical protein RRG08_038308 [Elysia crispata]
MSAAAGCVDNCVLCDSHGTSGLTITRDVQGSTRPTGTPPDGRGRMLRHHLFTHPFSSGSGWLGARVSTPPRSPRGFGPVAKRLGEQFRLGLYVTRQRQGRESE